MLNYLRELDFLKYQSVQAIGIGVSMYVGLKSSELSPNLSKVIIGISSIAALHFGGLLEPRGFIRNRVGVGIPFYNHVKLAFSINDVIMAVNDPKNFGTNLWESFKGKFTGIFS